MFRHDKQDSRWPHYYRQEVHRSIRRPVHGNEVRAFWDDRNVCVARLARALRYRLFDRVDRPYAGKLAVTGRQPARVKKDGSGLRRPELHLSLPLIDIGEALTADLGEESISAQSSEPLLRLDIFLGPHALRALRGHGVPGICRGAKAARS